LGANGIAHTANLRMIKAKQYRKNGIVMKLYVTGKWHSQISLSHLQDILNSA
jgi:hypothetical protein